MGSDVPPPWERRAPALTTTTTTGAARGQEVAWPILSKLAVSSELDYDVIVLRVVQGTAV